MLLLHDEEERRIRGVERNSRKPNSARPSVSCRDSQPQDKEPGDTRPIEDCFSNPSFASRSTLP